MKKPRFPGITRRSFLQGSAGLAGALPLLASAGAGAEDSNSEGRPGADGQGAEGRLPDLRPARWIWYPSGRCLPSTFVLFRKELELNAEPRRARGWILADSRYLLSVNGKRIQWGPAPSDPRWMEVDPLDLTDALRQGRNVLGAQVLFYGHGDGTWPAGKPGFLFWLEVEIEGAPPRKVVSDASWSAHMARSWRPGQYKRWYLRALQEDFDARLYPHGWNAPGFAPGGDWLPAMPLGCPADKPPICSSYPDYLMDSGADPAGCELRPRSIPLLRELMVSAKGLVEHAWIDWKRPPEEYFESLTPGAFEANPGPAAAQEKPGVWKVLLDGRRAAALTFELEEQVVGWPRFTVEAPAGTIIECMVQEAHQVGGPPLLNTHFHSWTRFTCKEGTNEFETFDFESLRWIQLHIRSARGPVTVWDVGVRRRMFPWPHEPEIRSSEAPLDRLFQASINTLHNCAQETCVDGMGRERQQYSGDGGHQLHAIHQVFGETRLPARFLKTFSQGMTLDGYFLDCWPAYDRLARLMERPLQMSGWGPILDHGIGFNLDCHHHYMYTGDARAIEEPFPRLLRFAEYLKSIRRPDGLLPVEQVGVPSVWMDHQAYARQRHKQCAFNLYAAAMLRHALPAICRALGNEEKAARAESLGTEILAAAVRSFWSPEKGIFINNLPWLPEEGGVRLCDRSLATSVLFDQCPGGRVDPALQALADCPAQMGLSYPCNAGWRLWALAKGGRADVIVRDFRERWATMDSVRLNNTLQEDWKAAPDSGAQWSHCAVVPLYVLTMSILGLKPLSPGFARLEVRPQLADLEGLEATARTVRGPIRLESRGKKGSREVILAVPPGCEAELVVPREEKPELERSSESGSSPLARYRLPAGKKTRLFLEHA